MLFMSRKVATQKGPANIKKISISIYKYNIVFSFEESLFIQFIQS